MSENKSYGRCVGRPTTRISRRKLLTMLAGCAGIAVVGAAAGCTPTSAPTPTTGSVSQGEAAATAVPTTPAATPAPKEAIKVAYWEKWVGQDRSGVDVVTEAWNRDNPAIQVEVVSTTDIAQKALVAIWRRDSADILGLWPDTQAEWVVRKAFIALDDYLDGSTIKKENYFPRTWEWQEHDGKVWGLPSSCAAPGLYLNHQLIEGAGLDPSQPPQTLDEMDAFAEKLHKKDSAGKVLQMGFIPWYRYPRVWASPPLFGGKVYDRATQKYVLTDAGTVEWLTWEKSYIDKYGMTDVMDFTSGFGALMGAENPFLTGQMAAVYETPFFVGYIKKFAPDLQFSVGWYPEAPAGFTKFAHPIGDSMNIPVGAKHPDAAFAYLEHYHSVESMQAAFALSSQIPPLREAANSTKFIDESVLAPYTQYFVDVMNSDESVNYPLTPNSSFMTTQLTNARMAVLQGEKTIEQALKDAEETAQKDLDEILQTGQIA